MVMSRSERSEALMDTALTLVEAELADGKMSPAMLSNIHKMFKDAGLSLAIDGKPTTAAVTSVLDAMKDYEPDYLN
jgi:hypothetical protein